MSVAPLPHLEYLPEPEDPRMLTAIDPEAPGYPPEAYGATPEQAAAWREATRESLRTVKRVQPWGGIALVLLILAAAMAYPWLTERYGAAFIPDSEWAYEDSGLRALAAEHGLDGEGIRVCIVDTGIDMNHPDFDFDLIAYRDFIANDHDTIQDRGEDRHGTMMAGILVSKGIVQGAAPRASVAIAAALDSDGSTRSEAVIAHAIEWCANDVDAHIISLSLGGEPEPGTEDSATAEAVENALSKGIFVVAAAGNSGTDGSTSDVSTPANIEGVIAVGALMENGSVWPESAYGSENDTAGELRTYPHQKPEITAPGVEIISTSDPGLAVPYSSSSGTSDATVFVTSALTLILERHWSALTDDGLAADRADIDLVKQALADSATGQADHDLHAGYGALDAVAWESAVADAIQARDGA